MHRRLLLGLGLSVVSAGLLIWFLVAPTLNYLSAKNWREHECVITHSERSVKVDRSDEARFSYDIVVEYRYDVDGKTYQSNRHSFFLHDGGDGDAIEQEVRRLAKGNRVLCYVDPSAPSEAVIDRSFGLLSLVFLLLALPLGIGLKLLFGLLRARRAGSSAQK